MRFKLLPTGFSIQVSPPSKVSSIGELCPPIQPWFSVKNPTAWISVSGTGLLLHVSPLSVDLINCPVFGNIDSTEPKITAGLLAKRCNFQTYSPSIGVVYKVVQVCPPSVVCKTTPPLAFVPEAKPLFSSVNNTSTKAVA